MATMTYTAPAATSTSVATIGKLLAALNTISAFLNVFFGASADQDSKFRGLDMNGNPMWAR